MKDCDETFLKLLEHPKDSVPNIGGKPETTQSMVYGENPKYYKTMDNQQPRPKGKVQRL